MILYTPIFFNIIPNDTIKILYSFTFLFARMCLRGNRPGSGISEMKNLPSSLGICREWAPEPTMTPEATGPPAPSIKVVQYLPITCAHSPVHFQLPLDSL